MFGTTSLKVVQGLTVLYQFRMHDEEARWLLELPGQPGEPMWPKSALVVQIACLLTSNFKFCNAMSFFHFFLFCLQQYRVARKEWLLKKPSFNKDQSMHS